MLARAHSNLVARRSLLALGVSLSLFSIIVLAGCGGGGDGSGGIVAPTPTHVVLSTNSTVVGTEQGQNTVLLATFTDSSGHNFSFFGSRDPLGNATRITQSLAWDSAPSAGVRAYYDATGRPVTVRSEATGYFATITWEAARAIFRYYSPTGAYLGAASITPSGSSYVVAAYSDPIPSGAFQGTLVGSETGTISFTFGSSRAAAPTRAWSVLHAPDPVAAASGTRASSRAGGLVAKLSSLGELLYTPGFINSLLQTISAGTAITGGAPAVPALAYSAGTGTDPAAVQFFGSTQFGLGLIAPWVFGDTVHALDVRITNGSDPEADGTVTGSAVTPTGLTWRDPATLPTPGATGRSLSATGVAVFRSIGAVPLAGTLDAAGNLSLAGTADGGAQVTVVGHLVNGVLTQAEWEQSQGGSGTWTVNQGQIATCGTSQSSTPDNTFAKVYDLSTTHGTFGFQYNAYTIPDRFEIFYEGHKVYDSGSVTGAGNAPVTFSGSSTQITVVVISDTSSVAWTYAVGCP